MQRLKQKLVQPLPGPKAEALTRANIIRCEFAVYKLCMPTTQQLATRLLGGRGRGPESVASGQRAAGSKNKLVALTQQD